jgi:uncharacterized lipoprotein YbaY
MKRTRMLLAALAFTPLAALAGTADVRFIEPDRFTDLASARAEEAANMAAIGAHLRQLAAALPADQVLRVDVLDVDLAGTVRHNSRGDKRVASGRADAPHFHLRYALEANGKVIRTGDEHVTDIDYMHTGLSMGRSHSPLYYEKRMLSQWFTRNFVPDGQAAR